MPQFFQVNYNYFRVIFTTLMWVKYSPHFIGQDCPMTQICKTNKTLYYRNNFFQCFVLGCQNTNSLNVVLKKCYQNDERNNRTLL